MLSCFLVVFLLVELRKEQNISITCISIKREKQGTSGKVSVFRGETSTPVSGGGLSFIPTEQVPSWFLQGISVGLWLGFQGVLGSG